jgi:hypothetical protein
MTCVTLTMMSGRESKAETTVANVPRPPPEAAPEATVTVGRRRADDGLAVEAARPDEPWRNARGDGERVEP